MASRNPASAGAQGNTNVTNGCINLSTDDAEQYFHSAIYGDPVETPLPGALFAPAGTSEPIEAGRTAVITNPTLYFPGAWPDIVPTDQVSDTSSGPRAPMIERRRDQERAPPPSNQKERIMPGSSGPSPHHAR